MLCDNLQGAIGDELESAQNSAAIKERQATQSQQSYLVLAIVVILIIAVIIIAVVVGVFWHRQKMHKQKVQQGLFLAGAISNKWRSNKKNVSIVPEMSKKVNEDWLTKDSREANQHDLRVKEELKWKG